MKGCGVRTNFLRSRTDCMDSAGRWDRAMTKTERKGETIETQA